MMMAAPTTTDTQASPQEQHCQLLKESLRERMEVMFWQEATHYSTKDYLVECGPSSSLEREGVMSEQWRTRMCEWAYQCNLTIAPEQRLRRRGIQREG